MRTRRVKLSAQQLMSRNLSEAIVDKDNHAADASKYVVMSHPEPTKKSYDARVAERLGKLWKEQDPTTAMLQLSKIQEEEREADSTMSYYAGNIRHALSLEARKNHHHLIMNKGTKITHEEEMEEDNPNTYYARNAREYTNMEQARILRGYRGF